MSSNKLQDSNLAHHKEKRIRGFERLARFSRARVGGGSVSHNGIDRREVRQYKRGLVPQRSDRPRRVTVEKETSLATSQVIDGLRRNNQAEEKTAGKGRITATREERGWSRKKNLVRTLLKSSITREEGMTYGWGGA